MKEEEMKETIDLMREAKQRNYPGAYDVPLEHTDDCSIWKTDECNCDAEERRLKEVLTDEQFKEINIIRRSDVK